LSALGDVVCTLPAASALKARFPDCHVTWAVDPRFAGIVEACSAVDEVVRVKPGLRTIPSWPMPFDAAFDLQGLLKSAICVGRAKAPEKLGYHWQREAAWAFSARVLPDPTSFHVVDQYVDVVRAFRPDENPLASDVAEFALTPQDGPLETVREKLAAIGVSGRFVVMNAGAGWVTKRWPPAHFAAVCRSLGQDGVPVVFLGGKGDQAAVAEVLDGLPPRTAFDLAGQTNIPELVGLVSLAAAHLGGDTGSTHLAAALGIPAIGLYSITRPQRSCPYGQIERCHYDPAGLGNILPEPVTETLREVLR